MYQRRRDSREAKVRRLAVASVVAVIAAVAVVGCGSSSTSTSTSNSASATNSSGTSQHVTLNFMSLSNSPGVEAAWGQLIKAYEQQNPGVTINRSPVAYANYRTRVKLQASASDAPDMVEGDMGPGGVMASLVTELESSASAPSRITSRTSLEPDSVNCDLTP